MVIAGVRAQHTRGEFTLACSCPHAADDAGAISLSSPPPAAKGEEYLNRMRKVALPDHQSISGNRGAFCLYRMESDVAHFEMLTFWDDVDAIKRFAGEDFQLAKYYDFDRAFLVELEPKFTRKLASVASNLYASPGSSLTVVEK
jgi:hypothetical protein